MKPILPTPIQRFLIVGAVCWVYGSMAFLHPRSAAAGDSSSILMDPAVDTASFIDKDTLNECSGLAFSHRNAKRFWTHNDSGGMPQLFAVDQNGKSRGQCKLKGIDPTDWEDMASFKVGEIPYLLVADCGDNRGIRKSIQLYIFKEPNPDKSTTLDEFLTLKVNYDSGPQNCEAVAVDSKRKQIILIGKTRFLPASVHVLPLPKNIKNGKANLQATRIGSLPIPFVTAMDCDVANGDIWVINYFQAFRFRRSQTTNSIAQQIKTLPQPISLPKWKQIEAATVNHESRLWISSEGRPTPLGRLKVRN